MRTEYRCTAAVLLSGLLLTSSISAAQSADDQRGLVDPPQLESSPTTSEPDVILSEERLQELQRWTHDFAKWQESMDRRSRRRQTVRSYVKLRDSKPDPPAWLSEACVFLAGDAQLAPACEWLVRWRDDALAAKDRQTRAISQAQLEKPTNSIWWRHLHLDGLWSTTQTNVAALGVFGAHFTVDLGGHLQVFVAPGILLVSVHDITLNRQLLPATDWGMSYRLFNVGRATVHVNLVHAWLLAGNGSAMNPNMTLGGFSVSFHPRPR